MSQIHTVGSHKTTVHWDTDSGYRTIVYHSTAVVKFNFDTIILNTGGYKTVTTKRRMNQASNQFDLGYYVYQKNFDWFVCFQGEEIPFENDTITLHRRKDNEAISDCN
jgi:hypothetical protein